MTVRIEPMTEAHADAVLAAFPSADPTGRIALRELRSLTLEVPVAYAEHILGRVQLPPTLRKLRLALEAPHSQAARVAGLCRAEPPLRHLKSTDQVRKCPGLPFESRMSSLHVCAIPLPSCTGRSRMPSPGEEHRAHC